MIIKNDHIMKNKIIFITPIIIYNIFYNIIINITNITIYNYYYYNTTYIIIHNNI